MKVTYGKTWRKGKKLFRWAYTEGHRQLQEKVGKKWKYRGKVFALAAGGVWVVTKAVGLWVFFHRLEYGRGF
jgi:hypothetical protein